MKKFCESLREYAKSIIDFEKKKMLPSTRKELKSFIDADVCYICRIIFLKKLSKNMNYQKVRDHCHYTGKYRGAARSICNLKFNVPSEIPVVFHNGSNYDYNFIIKELANEFNSNLNVLEITKNNRKQKIFSVRIKKKTIKVDKDNNETVETISYKEKKSLIVQDLWRAHSRILSII